MTPKRHLAALSVVSCGLLLLIGCGTDPRPEVLGPGVVTPASSPSESSTSTEEPNASASSSPTPTDSPSPRVASPSPTPSPVPSPTPSRTPSPDPDPDAVCGGGGTGSNAGPRPAPGRFPDDDAELDAENQHGNGRFVDVDDVQISRSNGFVAVCWREMGRLLGSARIARSDDDRDVRITLDERITKTIELGLILYADAGDGRLDGVDDRVVSDDDYEDKDDLAVEFLTYRYTG